MLQKTFAMIKPDAVEARCAGKIIDMIESAGMSIVAMKMQHLSRETTAAFYAVHQNQYFFDRLVDFMSSGPSIMIVLQGEDVVASWRTLMGATDPAKATEGTIRKHFGTNTPRNATHGSDSPESALQEIRFFFPDLSNQ